MRSIIELRRVALTPAQIRELGIPVHLKEVKPKGHGKEFIEQGLQPAAQLEAVPPDTLSHLVRKAVEDALDMDALRASQEREHREYIEVQVKIDEVNAMLRDAFGS
jgi:hypothetical protein